ncbi:MAG: Flavodoxin reductases (ferredoxin-NADPH reductases) family 1 [Ktedonobacterales bacterium]|nr:MAG: Flavodoxin reductases (ferredoxin-NADPH reductases) family 1 [Ktedonobacterales bacterium]
MRDDNPTRGLPIAAPANMLPVQVVRREVVAPDVVTVSIVLPGTSQAPAPYLPGQFVTLALPTPRETLYRSYSLCGRGNASEPWELTIKKVEMGAVSTYFYKLVQEGTMLYASLPRGTFTLPANLGPEMSVVFVAAGSGITPIMGMLRALETYAPDERPLALLHYASRTPEDVIFADELDAMDPYENWLRQVHYLSSEGSRMSAEAIFSRTGMFAAKAHWYICGPDQLKSDIQVRLKALRVPPEHIHSEAFATSSGPAYKVDSRDTGSLRGSIYVLETGQTLDVQPQETILVALERHGYRPNFSCRAGACGECKLRVTDGQVDPVGEALTPQDRRDGFVLSCLAHPIGDVTIASGGRPPAGVARVAAAAAIAGVASVRSAGAVGFTRLAALAAAGVLLVGSWNLTNHRPLSWSQAAAAQAGPTSTTASDTPAPANSATPGHKPMPTATRSGGGGGGTAATSTPTTKPKPTPTATSTKSPAH